MLKTANRRLSWLSLKYGAMETEGWSGDPWLWWGKGQWWITHPQLHGTISPWHQDSSNLCFSWSRHKSLWFTLCSLRWKRWHLLVLEGWSSSVIFFNIVLSATVVFILRFALLSLKHCCECSVEVSFQNKSAVWPCQPSFCSELILVWWLELSPQIITIWHAILNVMFISLLGDGNKKLPGALWMQISYLLAMVTLYYIMTILLKAHLNWLNISIEFHNLLQILLFKMDILHRVADRHFLEWGEQRKLVKLCINKLQSLIRQESSGEINYEFTTVGILLIRSKHSKNNSTIPWNFI